MRKIGINLHAVEGLTDEQYIKTAADLGFLATFSGVYDKQRQYDVAELCAKYGVAYETLHAPFGKGSNNMWLEGAAGDTFLGELMRAVCHCAIAGVPVLVSHLSSGENAPPVTDIGRARYTRLVEYAASKNVKIAFENQRKLANLAWTMETFDDSVVGFCWDCGHETCFTPGREYMPLFGDRLICTHIHDNFCIYDQDSHLLPFDGNKDFEKVAAHLNRSPFRGTLMLEVITENSNVYDGMTPEAYLTRSAEAAKKLADMVNK